VRRIFRPRRAAGRGGLKRMPMSMVGARRHAIAVGAAAIALVGVAATVAAADHRSTTTLAIHITSPLGRTGLPGPIRIVAQVQRPEKVDIQPVDIYVDGQYLGEALDGPPFAVEWTDEDPFEPRDIRADVCDDLGDCASDLVHLAPLTITEVSGISSVLVEA